jgi:high-affinity iron transporter
MLAWTVVWMANHSRQMTIDLRSVGRHVEEGSRPLAALAIAVGMAVLREGAEVVLFLYSILVAGGDSPIDVVLGAIGGLALGGAVSFAMYRGLIIIPIKQLFRTTSVLISLLAAGLAAQSVVILQSAGFLQSLSNPLWDTGWLLAEDSWGGRVLHALVGYTTQPTGMQIGVQVVTLIVIAALSNAVRGHVRRTSGDVQARSSTPAGPS